QLADIQLDAGEGPDPARVENHATVGFDPAGKGEHFATLIDQVVVVSIKEGRTAGDTAHTGSRTCRSGLATEFSRACDVFKERIPRHFFKGCVDAQVAHMTVHGRDINPSLL